jgi:hypothetical protein
MSTEAPSSSSHDTEQNRLKEIEINRIKAKSRIRAEAEARNAQSSRNINGKRPVGVTTGDSDSPTKKTTDSKDANAPLKRDTRLMGAPLFSLFYDNSQTAC